MKEMVEVVWMDAKSYYRDEDMTKEKMKKPSNEISGKLFPV